VISVCDSAANDCPVWLGKSKGGGNPKRLHRPLPDPKTKEDFERTYQLLLEDISALFR